MTISEFKKTMPNSESTEKEDFFDFMSDATEIWSNNACMGYVLYALEHMKKDNKEIEAVLQEIKACFNNYTLDEADNHYCHSPY